MKTTKSIILLLALSAIMVTSCKKSSKEEEAVPAPPPAPTNYVCTGNGTTSYMPLKQGNKWELVDIFNYKDIEEVSGTSVFSGKTYFKTINETGNPYNYFRVETNGDIYRYYNYSSGGVEYKYVPANPAVGQIISITNQGLMLETTRKVTSINATLTTPSCSYTGLLKIEEFYTQGSNPTASSHTQYYKKGIGKVQDFVALTPYNLKTAVLN